ELRAGRPVILKSSAAESVLLLTADGLTDEKLAFLRGLCAPQRPYLLVTARRARALGLAADGPTGLAIGDLINASAVFSLAHDRQVTRHTETVPAGKTASAALGLAKLAQRLPALLIGP